MKKHFESVGDAAYEVIHQSAVPAKRQADYLNISYSRLTNSVLDSAQGDYPVRWIIPQAILTGNYTLIDYIDEQLGRVAVSVADIDKCVATPASLEGDILTAMREMGEMAGVYQEVTADGHLSGRDIDICLKETWDLVSAAVRTHRKLQELKEKGGQNG